MSRASTTFAIAIEDASALLRQFDAVHKDNQNTGEVLKRAGLVMALTAWETFVEDRIAEAVKARLKAVSGSPLGKCVAASSPRNSGGSTARRPRRHAGCSQRPRDEPHRRLEVAEPQPRQRAQEA